MHSPRDVGPAVFEQLDSRLLLDVAPPTAVCELNEGAAQRAYVATLDLLFSEDVTVAKDDLSLYDYSTESPVDLTDAGFGYEAPTRTATWDLSGVALNSAYHLNTTLTFSSVLDLCLSRFFAGYSLSVGHTLPRNGLKWPYQIQTSGVFTLSVTSL